MLNQNNSINQETYPLSPLQQGMLFHYLYNQEGGKYIQQLICRLHEALNIPAFEQSWQKVIERHSILRTRFQWEGLEQPQQMVHKQVECPLKIQDLCDLSSKTQKKQIADYIQQDRKQDFSLTEAPVMRFTLFQLSKDNYQFIWTSHHILLDGRSRFLILRELFTLYAAYCQNQEIELPEPHPYKEYIDWLQQQDFSKSEQFWRKTLKGVQAPTPLINGWVNDSDSVEKLTYADKTLHLTETLTKDLQSLAKSADLTLNTLMQGVWALLLSRYSGEETVIFGATRACRYWTDIEPKSRIGLFINTLPVCTRVVPDLDLSTWLQNLHHQWVAIKDHNILSLTEIQKCSEIPANLRLFETLIVFEDNDINIEPASGYDWTECQFELPRQDDYPLSLYVMADTRLHLTFKYEPQRFDAATINRMIGHFQTLLEGMIANPKQRISALPWLTQAERHQLLVEWNANQIEYSQQCAHHLFEAQVKQHPDAVAIVFEEQALTYQELNIRSNKLANYLQALTVGPEVIVGLCMERSLDIVVGVLGILKAGGAYLSLDPNYPKERIAFMLKDTQVSVLLTQQQLLNWLPPNKARIVCLDSDWKTIIQESQENPVFQATLENLAYVIYTSGSTGTPKGVMVNHASLCSYVQSIRVPLKLNDNDTYLHTASFGFSASVRQLMVPLTHALKVVLASIEQRANPLKLFELIKQQAVTIVDFSPSYWRNSIEVLNRLDTADKQSLLNNKLRLILSSAESLSSDIPKRWRQDIKADTYLLNMYGQTETTGMVSFYPLPKLDHEHITSVPIGKPLPNVQIYLLEANLQPVPIGVVGELYIGGLQSARGYINLPEQSASTFMANPFSTDKAARMCKTGDLARYRPDGTIEFIGRLDNQVKIRGFRIELGEIEAVLAQHPSVRENAVIVQEISKTEPRLIAFIVAQPEQVIDNAELRGFLNERLPDYMRPSAFVMIDVMPLIPNGKVDRHALPALESQYPKLETTYIIPQTEAEQRIAVVWQQVLQLKKVGIYDNFFELGGNSLLMAQVQSKLQILFKKPSLSVVELFQYPTIYALAKHLTQEDIQETSEVFKTSKVSSNKDIAIIGMSCRVPGAENVDTFWQNLCDGIESITFFTDEELLAKGVEPTLLNDPNYVKASPVLEGIELFDAPFFGYSPREAEIMDPQHRLFLECAWEAIENAGYDVERVKEAIGVYAGTNRSTYLLDNLYSNRELREAGSSFFQLMIGNDKDFLATRTSYKLDLKGPSISIQTACSTSLVAVHVACQSLLAGDCDIALAGGVSIIARQNEGYLNDGTIFSHDGHCRAFDARAQGTVNGNGLGIVVLKRLEQALTDGDCIHAVIKASAINNDGALKVGYTAPSVDGQTALIAKAMQEIDPETISYIETHGTGTALGDPIEITALTQAFRRYTQKKGYCAIGSLKSNMGHLIEAAGVAGLIKTVLALKHKKLPPSLHFEQPNPKIDFANSPFFVNTTLSEWKSDGAPRRAGVSSFGIGGTNAHVILEEAPLSVGAIPCGCPSQLTVNSDSQPSKPKRPWQLLVLSAKTASALETATANLAEHLKQHPDINLADVAYTLSQGRKVFEHRRILACQTVDEATEALSTLAPILTHIERHKMRPVVFMFSGQGSQYVNMALELYQHELIFREQVDKCAEILKPHLNLDLRNVLYPNAEQIAEAEKQLEQTAITQPALFVIEYALAQLWIAWGLQPVAMIGHSIGEYVAACLAQVFSLEDALALVAVRGQLMQSCPSGSMLSVPLPEAEVKQLMNQVNQELSLAAHNAPSLCAVSGTKEAVTNLKNRLTAQGVECLRLHTSHAFHSAMMEPILAPFTAQIKKMRLHPPQMSYLSNVSGTWITAAEATNPDYWARHLRHTVRFAEGLQELLKNPESVLLEIGPGRTLATLAGRHPDKTAEHKIFHSVRHPKDQQADLSFLLTTLGKLWLAGVSIDWSSFYAEEQRQRLPLPTYPFERQRYWIEAPKSVPQASLDKKPAIFLDKKPDMSDWFYLPVWKQSTPLLTKPEKLAASCWLVFLDPCDLGTQLSKKLEQIDQEVITVKVGTELTQINDSEYTLNPQQSEDYEALLKKLRTLNKIPQTIVHLWTVTHNSDEAPKYERVDEAQTLGFYSLLFLTQAIEKQELTNDIQLMLVSNNVQKVTGEETLYPEKSTVLGPIKIIGQEYPNIHCRSIDVLIPPEKIEFEQLIDLLWAELTNQTTDKMVAYRAGHRWVQTFEAVRLEEPLNRKSRLREGGTYLITGGLGGIGLVLAEHLAKTVHANLILTGRSQLPSRSDWDEWLTTHDEHDNVSRKIRKVQALEKQGGKVMTTRADVANQQQMEEVIKQAKQQFGLINGVIHAAGVPDGALIPRQTPKTAETIFSPKIKGTLVLDQILSEFELDFLVLCSSIASVFGTGGQVSYTAANSFLDAFAHFKNTKGDKSTIAINWDAWQEEGMAVDALDHYGRISQTVAQVSVSNPRQTKAVSHPLFDDCIIESAVQERYISHLSVSQFWFLDEHRIKGKSVLPATAYLELARAAFEPHAKLDTIEIREIYFLYPLIVPENEEKEVHTVLTKQGDHFEFVISSRTGPETWQEHAKGFITDTAAQPTKYNIEAIERDCQQPKIISNGLAQTVLEASMVQFGPHWYSLQWMKLGHRQGLAFLELANDLVADLNVYQLHPALLDMAVIFLKLHEQSQVLNLPFYYKKVTIKAPLPAKFYSYVRYVDRAQTLKFNVTLIDEQGMELVNIEEFTSREVTDDKVNRGMAKSNSLVSNKNSKQQRAQELPSPEIAGKGTTITDILQKNIKNGLLSTEGVDVFTRIMTAQFPQIIVSTRDLSSRFEQSNISTVLSFATKAESATSSLKSTAHPRPQIGSAYLAPRSDMEKTLADIWQKLLGIEQIGIHDDFFELGGDSLLATRIISHLRETCNIGLDINILFDKPTVAAIVEYIEKLDVQNPTASHDTKGKRIEGEI
ncbi:MAG: amino acid adenylation domain-containing protein [Thiomargarita sp.]|nr:amino acid adenylation domain-containing protein [Thiomargarita sp.]